MKDLFGDKVERAIELLRMYQPKDRPYYGCFSGGKDSCVIKEIARLGEINVIWHYNVTTIDPPELCRFIKREHPDVIWGKPKENFFSALVRKGFPTRTVRWCCELFKESKAPSGSVMVMGVRAAESPRRAKLWREFTANNKNKSFFVNSILYWRDEEVWDFLKSRGIPYSSLYDEGWKRLGCVGCPMSDNRRREFARWPHLERAWRRAFSDLWERREGQFVPVKRYDPIKKDYEKRIEPWVGEKFWKSSDEMFEWWLSNDPYPVEDECQGILDMYS
jgi:phosphoadenosine phosphosulfate reductase